MKICLTIFFCIVLCFLFSCTGHGKISGSSAYASPEPMADEETTVGMNSHVHTSDQDGYDAPQPALDNSFGLLVCSGAEEETASNSLPDGNKSLHAYQNSATREIDPGFTLIENRNSQGHSIERSSGCHGLATTSFRPLAGWHRVSGRIRSRRCDERINAFLEPTGLYAGYKPVEKIPIHINSRFVNGQSLWNWALANYALGQCYGDAPGESIGRGCVISWDDGEFFYKQRSCNYFFAYGSGVRHSFWN
jgi:hypothetical protein